MSYCEIEATRQVLPFAKQIRAITELEYPPVGDTPLLSKSDWWLCSGDEVEEIVPAVEKED